MITEKQFEIFLAMEYDELKKYLLNSSSAIKKAILNDIRIKDKLINCQKRYDFIWLAQEKDNEIIPLLLEGEGIDLLSNSNDLVDKLNGIITSSNAYVNNLLIEDKFNRLIVDNFYNLKYILNSLDNDGAIRLVKYVINKEKDNNKLLTVFSELSLDSQLETINSISLPMNMLKQFLVHSKPLVAKEIVEKYTNYIDLSDFSLVEMNSMALKGINLPDKMLNNNVFLSKLTTLYDIKEYRMLINSLSLGNDISSFENKREDYYNNELSTFKTTDNMLKRFSACYNSLMQLKEKDNFSDNEEIRNIIDICIPSYADSASIYKYYNEIFHYINNADLDGLKEYFIKESNYQLTNIIIDYHFKDVYFNVLIDIKQLLEFNKDGGKSLNNEDLLLYQSIFSLDKLDYDSKIKVHEQLKNYNMVDKFYDDIRNAKNQSYQMIKNEMLTLDKLKKYKNNEYSNKCGVDIYVLDGDSFYAFIKAYNLPKDCIIKEMSHVYVDAGSFSLDGSDKLQTFCDPHDDYNILYGNFNIDQVIHTYPVDSFSGYVRGYKENATDRVNEILTPKSFVSKSSDYNELVLLQRNEHKEDDELNNTLENPTPIAIYCYDKITPNDIISAQNLGIGIVVVNTKAYSTVRNDSQISVHDTTVTGNEVLDSNYLTSIFEDAMYGRK